MTRRADHPAHLFIPPPPPAPADWQPPHGSAIAAAVLAVIALMFVATCIAAVLVAT